MNIYTHLPVLVRQSEQPTHQQDTHYIHWLPKTDIIENEHYFKLFVEVPGISKEDISITTDDQFLIINGERKYSGFNENDVVRVRERMTGQFQRKFRLSGQLETSQIQAQLNNGVLTLFIPKKETAKTKTIQIQ